MNNKMNKYTKITEWAFGDAVTDHSLERRGLIGRQDNSDLCARQVLRKSPSEKKNREKVKCIQRPHIVPLEQKMVQR